MLLVVGCCTYVAICWIEINVIHKKKENDANFDYNYN